MSKFSKHLKDKEYRRHTREVNRNIAKKMVKMSEIDDRSNLNVFKQWMAECCDDQLYIDENNRLSIGGSDGITVSKYKIGNAFIDRPVEVDQELEINGYYEDRPGGVLNLKPGEETYEYHKPTMTYLEWFNKKYKRF